MSFISDIQTIGKILQKAGNVGLYEKLLAIEEKALEIEEENKSLRKEIDRLKEELRIKDSIEFEQNVYWLKNKGQNTKEGPFCPHCYDSGKLLMRLITEESIKEEFYYCHKCKFNITKI